ncbi:4Fe-4S dicluster domain-containing protein [Candidatus Poribacteria bacterium]|nr:4Fe-4S dicluster domain-containing protein [Candidatus Poribacteria bacterium]
MKRIDKDKLNSFLESIASEGYEVLVPSEERLGFARFDPDTKIPIEGITRRPIKSIFFPQTETLLEWHGDGPPIETPPDETKRLVFGARPCDLRALTLLDRVFMGEVVDPYYAARRRNTALFSLACSHPADGYCFCVMVGGDPFSVENSDALFIDIGESFLVKPITERGVKLLGDLPDEEVKESEIDDIAQRSRDAIRSNLLRSDLPTETVRIEPEKLWDLFDSEIWEEVRLGCIGCGVCSFLCPTCHCFDISDEKSKNGGRRIRVWDTCAFPVFTKQASGYNPRPTQRERIRQRVMHKFCYIPENFDILGCVGCGRCVRYCPGGSDIRYILVKLLRS